MTGKRYYVTTLRAWQGHMNRFSNSHWLTLRSAAAGEAKGGPNGDSAEDSPILLLVEADEGAHSALEDDPAFEPLPFPLTQTPVSENARSALAGLSLPSDATTFDVAEAASRFHPLLRHRVF
ncbi:MAG TPA: hypothetical protein VFW94_00770 [Candidatus Acidoferrales bacterium]|nr:hypothetical protein [Candidatus Acidoferrales bacterium]